MRRLKAGQLRTPAVTNHRIRLWLACSGGWVGRSDWFDLTQWQRQMREVLDGNEVVWQSELKELKREFEQSERERASRHYAHMDKWWRVNPDGDPLDERIAWEVSELRDARGDGEAEWKDFTSDQVARSIRWARKEGREPGWTPTGDDEFRLWTEHSNLRARWEARKKSDPEGDWSRDRLAQTIDHYALVDRPSSPAWRAARGYAPLQGCNDWRARGEGAMGYQPAWRYHVIDRAGNDFGYFEGDELRRSLGGGLVLIRCLSDGREIEVDRPGSANCDVDVIRAEATPIDPSWR